MQALTQVGLATHQGVEHGQGGDSHAHEASGGGLLALVEGLSSKETQSGVAGECRAPPYGCYE